MNKIPPFGKNIKEISRRVLFAAVRRWRMKKLLTVLLTLLFLTASVSVSALAIGSFGYAAEVLSSEVNLIKTGLRGQNITFSDADFKSTLCTADFDTVTITKIPPSTEGTLMLSGRRVKEGRTIKRRNLASLVFVPTSEDVTESRFYFKADGYIGDEEIECILKFIDRVNYAPSVDYDAVSAATVRTQEGVGVYSRLSGCDPEGDALDFIIVSYPKRGRLELTDKSEGRYCYTPDDGYTGSDKFSYVVRDEYGNYSRVATVNLRVNQRMCDVVYYDMESRSEYGAAIAMTAMGVMDGRVLGDGQYFEPDKTVTRAEFVAMAMKSLGIRRDSTLDKSFFDDDGDIPTALRGYVATAQRLGVISGDFKDGALLFSPNEDITRYEAARIMSALVGADGEGEESVFADYESVPIWARSGVGAMLTLGVFDEDTAKALGEKVTRADTASYLYKLSSNK